MDQIQSKRSLRGALLLAAAAAIFLSAPAFADEAVETVVVTGSRIPQANLTSVSPIQTVAGQDFALKGATDVSDLLNDLPQTFISNTSDFANANNPLSSPGGVTTVDLRGLGATRTLVLVNGRRLGVGDPNTGNPGAAPDLDQIPVPLIAHVEILTGGASATYGSDAVAGVVNFIMKSDFEGVQVDAQYGAYWHDNDNTFARNVEKATLAANTQGPLHIAPDSVFDGQNAAASLLMGTNSADGKGNVTAYITYRNASPVWMRSRDFSACQINITSHAFCSGSSNSNYFQPENGGPGTVYSIVGDQALPRPQPGSSPPSSFNSNNYETLARQDVRFTGGFFAHYDLVNWAKPYTEFSFMDDRSNTQIAPDAMFRGANSFSADGSGNWFTNCDNPELSAEEVQKFCTDQGVVAPNDTALQIGRRNIEGGPRQSFYEHMNFRGVIGVKGDITDAWHYDVFGSYYYVTVDQKNSNYLSNTKINNALEVVSVGGVPTCKSVVNGTDLSCVPYNIFLQGGVTPAALAYLTEKGTSRGSLAEQILEADLNGDLGKFGIRSPWATEGVKVAVGVTNRSDKLAFQADQAEQSNDLEGFGGAAVPIDNAINVTEEYGEVRIPVAQNQPYIEELTVDAGIRFSSYSNRKKPTTWKAGLQWAPTDDVRFRTSYDIAIRAPSILESFTPQTVTNTSIVSTDPCSGATPSATLAQCENTGVTPAQYGSISDCPSGQCAILLGGNPALSPEKAKTFSAGFTTTPTFFTGFTGSVDYFKIDVSNGIVQGIPIDISLANCLATGDPAFCSQVVRTSQGELFGTTIAGGGYIKGTFVNISSFNVSGIDVQATYASDLSDWGLGDYGTLTFNLTGSYTLTAKTLTLPGQPVYDCAGLFGNTCGSPLPRWRHGFRVSWQTPWDVTISPAWRFIGAASLDSNSTQKALSSGFDPLNARVPAVSYFDIAATWQFSSSLEFRAGVDNIFDRDPPIISNLITGTGTPNTYNSYDLLGRTMFVALTAKY